MNEIIEDFYLKYIECLNSKDRDICDLYYLNLKPTKKTHKDTWRFVNRGNFIKK